MNFTKLFTAALRRPSQRTLYEAQLTGMTILLLSSIFTPFYLFLYTDLSLAFKLFSSMGSIGIFLFLFSNLAITYVQYSTFKQQMGMYPIDYELEMKIDQAKQITEDLQELIDKYEVEQNVV
jgi:hypothetical protein